MKTHKMGFALKEENGGRLVSTLGTSMSAKGRDLPNGIKWMDTPTNLAVCKQMVQIRTLYYFIPFIHSLRRTK